MNALNPFSGWAEIDDEHEDQFAADGFDNIERRPPMGDGADLALENMMFPDRMYDQTHGYEEETDDWDDPEPCYGSDSARMLRRDRSGKTIECGEDDYWVRFGDPQQSSSYTGDLAGKYLIFSRYQTALVAIAEYEIWEHGFEVAKVSTEPRNGDYVLCLYWTDDQRKTELAERYQGRGDVKYRWWKSNADTRAGKYSDKHKGE